VTSTTTIEEHHPNRSSRAGAVRAITPFLLLAAFAVALDQASKEVIRAWLPKGDTWPEGWDLIRITHIDNSGAAFGILQDATLFLLLATVAGVALVIWYMIETIALGRWYGVALGLILGGALGNLIDRTARGYVTDFIDPANYPAFNLADSSIVIGVGILIVITLFGSPPADERSAAPEPEQ